MNTEQAYINGFVKRAMEYGYSQKEAMDILNKLAEPIAFKKPAPAAAKQKALGSVRSEGLKNLLDSL